MADKEKKCSTCNVVKQLSEFHKDKLSPDGYRYVCKECRKKPRRVIFDGNDKYCPKCCSWKNISQFYKDSNTSHGLSTYCKECVKSHVKTWRLENPEKKIKSSKLWSDNNKDYIRKYNKMYIMKNSHAIKEKKREYRDKHKNYISAKNAKYRRENKEKIREIAKLYQRKRRKMPEYKTLFNLRCRIRNALECHSSKKAYSTVDLIGCSPIKLKIHLEKQFQKGMSWNNYGKHGWHIDHRIPCASFDLTDPEEQKACFHFTNLQPLWAKDNIKKSDKAIYLI